MVSVKEAHLLMREFIPSGEEYLIRHIIFEFLDVILGAKYVCLSNEVFIFYLMNRFIEPWKYFVSPTSFLCCFRFENVIYNHSYKRHFCVQTDQLKFYHQYYILSTFPGACHSLWQFFFHRSYCPYLLSSILGSLNIWFAYSEMYFIRGNGFLNAAIMGLK